MTPRTLVDLFRNLEALKKPDLQLVKRDGTWRPISSAEFVENVRAISCALELLGVEPGGRVALLSENRPEWSMIDFACQCYGAVLVPIFPTMVSEQADYLLRDSGSTVAFVANDAQARKVFDAKPNCKDLREVVALDPVSFPSARPFAAVLEEGRKAHAQDPGAFERRADARKPEDLATLIYTSGTTGEPKGAMLTQDNFISNVVSACTLLPIDASAVALSFLPLSHVFERMLEYCYYNRGATIAFAESIDKVRDNLLEVNPMCFAAVPRVYEKIYAGVLANVEKSSPIKKALFRAAIETGKEVLRLREKKKTPGALLAMKHMALDALVGAKIRARFGSRFRYAVSGGAPLARELAEFLWAVGIEVYEGYGLTETSPVISVNAPSAWRLGTVGRILAGVEAKIADDGEILARGPNVMKGYFGKPEATREAIDEAGWFHTGDIGVIDEDGFLRITDRKKELIVNSNGKNIAPAPIESALKSDPFIAQPVVIGDRRKYLSCLIVPNFERLKEWAKTNGQASKAPEELILLPEVRDVFQKAIDRWNAGKSHEQLIVKFALLAAEFSIEGGELTPKLSVKRRVVDQKYKSLIDSMYDD